jgi:hypothetical protein
MVCVCPGPFPQGLCAADPIPGPLQMGCVWHEPRTAGPRQFPDVDRGPSPGPRRRVPDHRGPSPRCGRGGGSQSCLLPLRGGPLSGQLVPAAALATGVTGSPRLRRSGGGQSWQGVTLRGLCAADPLLVRSRWGACVPGPWAPVLPVAKEINNPGAHFGHRFGAGAAQLPDHPLDRDRVNRF